MPCRWPVALEHAIVRPQHPLGTAPMEALRVLWRGSGEGPLHSIVIARTTRERGAHYVLCVKENRSDLHDSILFAAIDP